ncbi:DHA2 family efflux MFS transporter permease subunit [Rhodococcus hoagii]|uniref:DHA2 family efflux MFS transporter permease subunit n=1 Tax=Rhodococcus hoagii TaxID=43767 RepID=A0AAE4ZKC0_RHOHA|nr:MFS transporter [Prescottella equi]MBU4616043.1 MFS transporter [Rhodococcus sp. GG48]NKR32005.1 DHA2 family efflux MFS transporter permease subunit [Prescottella equi]NKS28828.1 DHA2 family efflux MFS transporter permease subunit [Prescottella equi]NKS53181.1 DHA2 family efflux MFS transporter permease subunit [Prescottella equi]NKS59176.1 DHA2 family efflux MFS transporter permease subunit [Prescottella equi]
MTAPALQLKSPRGRWVVAATVLGSSLAMLDGTVVNVALPRIGEDLGAEVAGLQWVLSGYTLTLASLILFGGALGDRVGRRRVFVWGTVWFAGASALCALAPNVTILVAARLLQGVGAALLTPGSLAIISASFDEEDQGAAIGLWSGLGGVAAAVGPLLGGWLVEVAGWRSVFLINLPLAVAVVWVSARHVPETRDPHPPERLDVLGSALAALALGALTYGLIETAVWAVIAGLVLMAAFVVVERRSRYALVPGSLFASRVFVAANLVTLAVYAALGGVFFLLLLQLQIVSGYSPLAAGVASLPITVLMLLLSSRAGRWAQIHGPRIPMTVGPLLGAGGLLLMLRIGPGASYPTQVLPAVLVFGLGLSALVAPLTAAVLGSVSSDQAGIASGVNNAVARTSQLLAVAALPALAGIGADALADPAAFASGFRVAMLICAGLLLIGAVLSAVMIPRKAAAEETAGESVACQPHCDVTAPAVQPPTN